MLGVLSSATVPPATHAGFTIAFIHRFSHGNYFRALRSAVYTRVRRDEVGVAFVLGGMGGVPPGREQCRISLPPLGDAIQSRYRDHSSAARV